MEYKKTKWKNQVYDKDGNILQAGTPIKAESLNNIEDGIYDAHKKLKKCVKKEDGKTLSSNDFTDYYKKTLDTLDESYTNQNSPKGLVRLNEKGKIPTNIIPGQFKSNTVVKSLDAMENLEEVFEGLRVLVIDEEKGLWEEYMYDGERFIQLSTSKDTDIELDWNSISGKPEQYKPTKHNHTESDILGLDKYSKEEVDDKLKSKASLNHTHTVKEIINLDTMSKEEIKAKLEEKANQQHKHNISEITQDNKPYTEVINERFTDISNKISLQKHNLNQQLEKYLKKESIPNLETVNKIVDLGNHSQIDLDKIYTHKHSYRELEDKPKIPTKVGELENDSNYIKSTKPMKIHVSTTQPSNLKEGDLWIKI